MKVPAKQLTQPIAGCGHSRQSMRTRYGGIEWERVLLIKKVIIRTSLADVMANDWSEAANRSLNG